MSDKRRSIFDDIDEIEADEQSGKLEQSGDIEIKTYPGFASGGVAPREYPQPGDGGEE